MTDHSNNHITIRPATASDCPLIARNVLTALGWDMYAPVLNAELQEMGRLLQSVCSRTDTLYSWVNTLIAEWDGEAVGSLTGYDGANYQALRDVSFPIIAELFNCDFSGMECETGPGEFYFDTIAVHPDFRGRGIASSLINHCREACFAQGASQIALLVDPENVRAKQLYIDFGFQPEGFIFVFGHDYQKMISRK